MSIFCVVFFCFKQKTAYEMRISDWSSDVCSSDLVDITLVELAEMLRSEHGAVFAPSTIWRFLDRHSMTIKKNSARQRAGAARRSRAAARMVQGPDRQSVV